MHHPCTEVPGDIFRLLKISVFLCLAIKGQGSRKQRAGGFFIYTVSIQGAGRGKAPFIQFPVIEIESAPGAFQIRSVAGQPISRKQRRDQEATDCAAFPSDFPPAIPAFCKGSVRLLRVTDKITDPHCRFPIFRAGNPRPARQFLRFKKTLSRSAEVTGIDVKFPDPITVHCGFRHIRSVGPFLRFTVCGKTVRRLLRGLIKFNQHQAVWQAGKFYPTVQGGNRLVPGIFVSVTKILPQKCAADGRILSDPTDFILDFVTLCIITGGRIPLQAAVKRTETVFGPGPEAFEISNAKSVQIPGRHGRTQRMSVMPPRKIQQGRISHSGFTALMDMNHRLKIAAGFHCARISFLPIMAHQNPGPLLFRPDQSMSGVLAFAPLRAADRVILLRHQRGRPLAPFRIGTGGNCTAMPGKCPWNASVAVTQIFRTVPPSVSVVADCRNHGERGGSIRIKFHAHLTCRCGSMTLPQPCACLQHGEAILTILPWKNGENRCFTAFQDPVIFGPVKADFLCHGYTPLSIGKHLRRIPAVSSQSNRRDIETAAVSFSYNDHKRSV